MSWFPRKKDPVVQTPELPAWQAEVDRKYNELFPNGLTQEQIEDADRTMWHEGYYCGLCGKFMPISSFPHPHE